MHLGEAGLRGDGAAAACTLFFMPCLADEMDELERAAWLLSSSY